MANSTLATPEDCIKSGALILESLTAKSISFDKQLMIACSMLAILQASHPSSAQFKILEKTVREQAQIDVNSMFGVKTK